MLAHAKYVTLFLKPRAESKILVMLVKPFRLAHLNGLQFIMKNLLVGCTSHYRNEQRTIVVQGIPKIRNS